MTEDPIKIRQVVAGDLPYVFSTWLRDLRDADGGPLPDDLFFSAHRALIERLLGDPTVVALVACAADDPNEIWGFVVAQEGNLWWIQIRKAMRRKGLAGKLLQTASVSPGASAAWLTPCARERLTLRARGRLIRGATHRRARSARESTGQPVAASLPAQTR